MVKRIKCPTSVLVILLLISTVLVSCNPSKQTSENNMQDSAKISIFIGEADVACNRNDNPVIREIEKKTNMEIKILEAPKGHVDQKLALLIAGNDIPDIVCVSNVNNANHYATNGAFLQLDDKFDKSLSNVRKKISNDVIKMFTAADGKNYCLPMIRDIGSKSFFVREDWLKKLNMKMPNTLGEYYEMLKAFTESDPDGNGKRDTYGLGIDDYLDFVAPFGIPVDDWILDESGSVIRSSITPKMKDAITFAHRLFKEGIIDPEYATQNVQRRNEKSLNGIYGLRSMYTTSALSENVGIQKAALGGKYVRMPIPKAPGVAKGIIGSDYTVGDPTKRLSSNVTCISKESKNIDSCLKLLDWFFSDEGSRVVTFGVEGVHYIMEDGKPKFKTEYSGKNVNRGIEGLWDKFAFVGYFDQVDAWDQAYGSEAVAVMKESVENSYQKITFANTPTGEMIQGELDKTRTEIMTKIIMDGVSVEVGWNQWLKEFDRLGGNKWTKEVNDLVAKKN